MIPVASVANVYFTAVEGVLYKHAVGVGGLFDHVESEVGCHFVNWFQNGKYVLHL